MCGIKPYEENYKNRRDSRGQIDITIKILYMLVINYLQDGFKFCLTRFRSHGLHRQMVELLFFCYMNDNIYVCTI